MATNRSQELIAAGLLCFLVLVSGTASADESRRAERERARRLEKIAEQFFADIGQRKFTEATAPFSESLQPALSPDTLKQLVASAEADLAIPLAEEGAYVRDALLHDRTLYQGHLTFVRPLQIPLRRQTVLIPLRISFDSDDRIDGLWFDATSPETPEKLRGRNIAYGSLIELSRHASHILLVHALNPSGDPAEKPHVTAWRKVTLAEVPERWQQHLWHDHRDDTYWRGGEGGHVAGDTFVNLLPGKYRVITTGEHEGVALLGQSAPFEIIADRASDEITVPLQPGATVLVNTIDSVTKETTPRPSVVLRSLDGAWPNEFRCSADEPLPLSIRGVPPGKYRIAAGLSARTPDGITYELTEPEQSLEVADLAKQTVEVLLTGRPLTEEEIDRNWGWTAFGRVVDESGQPVVGAEVRAATGMGTLLGGGTTRTDSQGDFRLRFGEGMWGDDETGANAQFASFFVEAPNYLVKSSSRPAQTSMARKLAKPEGYFGYPPEATALKGQPYRLDFVLAKSAEISAALLDGKGAPVDCKLELIAESSDAVFPFRGPYHDDENVTRWGILPQTTYYFSTVASKEIGAVRSQSFTLPEAATYAAALRLHDDPATGLLLLEIERFAPAENIAAAAPVIGDDPLARPPVSAMLQERGRDLLRQVLARNRLWLGVEPLLVDNFAYTFRFSNGKSQDFQLTPDKLSPAWMRHGISHYSTLHYLVAHPEEVIFRQVEIGEERIALTYALRKYISTSAGNGVAGSWAGFRSGPARDGTLVLDAQPLVPLENHTQEFDETFSQYHEFADGQFVPLAMAVNAGDHRYRWTFQAFEPELWLFAASYDDGDLGAAPIATLDTVNIAGAAVQPLTVGRAEWELPAK